MKILIEIPNNEIPTRQGIIDIPIHFIDKQVVEVGGYEFMQIPDNATNGSIIQMFLASMYREVVVKHFDTFIRVVIDEVYTAFDKKWWNAKYEGGK